ncbi:MAG: heme A synthase [Acidimicrobiia bacterium]|nr:heme A synthase [Acidimicrobiia bacterium]
MLEATSDDPAIRSSSPCRSPWPFGVVEGLPYHRGVRLPRVSSRTYRRITLLALCAQVFIMVTGAAVRLTGSGLGCSDWPKCEQDQLVAPLEYHAMIEFLNRTITGLVSVAVIAAVLGSLLRSPRRADLTWWSLGLVAGVIGQIVLGGLTVLFELQPPFVIAHFLLSIVLVWNSYVLFVRAGHASGPALPAVAPIVRRLGRGLVVLAGLALFTGTIVTGSGPHGGDETVERLPLELVAVVRVHSLTVWAFLALAVITLGVLGRRGAPRDVALRARVLVAAICVQGAIGYVQYFTDVPPALVLVHVFGSIMVWLAVLSFDLSLTVRPLERYERPAEARPEKVAAP